MQGKAAIGGHVGGEEQKGKFSGGAGQLVAGVGWGHIRDVSDKSFVALPSSLGLADVQKE